MPRVSMKPDTLNLENRKFAQTPLRQPSTRVTLDAPGLPEPTVRMSTPLARATSTALGNVPIR